MLYPLSKSFSSTRLFQSGGVTSDPVPRRVWSLDNIDLKDKVADLHQVIFRKLPYEKQLEVSRKYAEGQRQRDIDHARGHKTMMLEVSDRMAETAREERATVQSRIRDFKDKKVESDATRQRAFRTQGKEWVVWRDEMQGRVAEMPALGSEGVPKETPERAREREDAKRSMKLRQKEYFQNNRAVTERLTEMASEARQNRPRGQSVDAAVEKKKAVGLRELSKSQRGWEGALEEMYGRHTDRIGEVQTGHLERRKEQLEKTKTGQLAMQLKIASQSKAGAKELKAREARMATRPKMMGGYNPVKKSDKRMREEEVFASEFGDATSTQRLGDTMRSRNSSKGVGSKQATLSPEQLLASTT
eukprot:TRINITY_DN91618_c0_g1_i1.p1 TRINITY_DN91618_c0_g1~~TRINITY_DN91618_c0_g1_i1.p1  ORF type:complete len:359 (-),score=97.79 TRINITY_DN91618_c0_g1_i1:122-1198(-)